MVASLLFEINYEFINRSSSIGLNHEIVIIIIIIIIIVALFSIPTRWLFINIYYKTRDTRFFFFLIDRHLMSMVTILTPRTRVLVAGMTPHQAGLVTV